MRLEKLFNKRNNRGHEKHTKNHGKFKYHPLNCFLSVFVILLNNEACGTNPKFDGND
jgi:hypothetical protein